MEPSIHAGGHRFTASPLNSRLQDYNSPPSRSVCLGKWIDVEPQSDQAKRRFPENMLTEAL
jgi:hypothetical protein